MRRISLFWLFALLIVDIHLSVGEPKRSFGLSGRNRAKSNSNLSVRRRTHVEPPKAPQPIAPKQSHVSHAASAPQAPVGPPPAYSAGPSSGKTNMHAAPPAYSANAAPPSYSAATGVNSHANYPRQSYSGVNSGTNLHQSAPGYGHANSPYNPSYGANNNHYGGGFAHPPPPNYGGYPSGGYGGMMNGGYGGMMGGGMMGGGMMGGGMMGGVQPMYMQPKSSGIGLGSIATGAISGLATYQLMRALSGGHGHHSSEQHIHHHYDNPQQNAQIPSMNPGTYTPQQTLPEQPQQTLPQQPQQTLQTSDANAQIPQYAQSVPNVPLAPFPGQEATKCTENCASDANIPVTPVPEVDYEFPFSTIHPSLFPYASPLQHSDLEYWAKSVNKKLNTTAPDTTNSNLQSTTVTP